MLLPPILSEIVDGRWRPGIGDPTVVGWLTVAAYLVAAFACGWAAFREPSTDGRASQEARGVLAGARDLDGLARNQQATRPPELRDGGRSPALDEGGTSIRIVGAIKSPSSGWSWWRASACSPGSSGPRADRSGIAVRPWSGWLSILGFVVIRAASFHHVDMLLASRLGGLKWNWILEVERDHRRRRLGLRVCLKRKSQSPRRRILTIIFSLIRDRDNRREDVAIQSAERRKDPLRPGHLGAAVFMSAIDDPISALTIDDVGPCRPGVCRALRRHLLVRQRQLVVPQSGPLLGPDVHPARPAGPDRLRQQHRHADARPRPDRDRLEALPSQAQEPDQRPEARRGDRPLDLLAAVHPELLAPDARPQRPAPGRADRLAQAPIWGSRTRRPPCRCRPGSRPSSG